MPLRFDWDEANVAKIWLKHRVGPDEAESTFDDSNRLTGAAKRISNEMRYFCIGLSAHGKLRTAIFTIRDMHIRIISCRHANKKEIRLYEETER